VLVVIGLIVGGVLLGQDLIRASEVRATISQIEKYNTAVRTFQGKFGFLPGDLNATAATQFQFAARGFYAGEGDGNGIIEGVYGNSAGQNRGYSEAGGETPMFWVDLSSSVAGNLIDGGFNTAFSTGVPGANVTGTNINLYLPQAKLGRGNYIYVWSGGANQGNGINYYGLSAITTIATGTGPSSSPNIPPAIAYAIDSKTDDGLPMTGNVTAQFINGGPGWRGATPGNTSTGTITTCYDDGGSLSNTTVYSIEVNNGASATCALAFQFQ